MIIQACLNGNRDAAFHPMLPTTPEAIVADGLAAVHAGANEIHVHVRDKAGRETLNPDDVDRTVAALRGACPGTLIGISTGAWIESDDRRRRDFIRNWSVLPDHASVNLIEDDCAAVIALLHERGIAVEAGLWTAGDAEKWLSLGLAHAALRALIEINHQDEDQAIREVAAIEAVLARSAVVKPVLLHGADAMMWPLIDRAFARRYATRVGLEDGRLLPDGRMAPNNAELVAAALERRRLGSAGGRGAPA